MHHCLNLHCHVCTFTAGIRNRGLASSQSHTVRGQSSALVLLSFVDKDKAASQKLLEHLLCARKDRLLCLTPGAVLPAL